MLEELLWAARLELVAKEQVELQLSTAPGYVRCEGGDQACDESCYTPMYQELMEQRLATRREPPRLLQIGLCYGESIKALAEWLFPVSGRVVGVDVDIKRFEAARHFLMGSDSPHALDSIQVFEGDAGNDAVVEELWRRFGAESFDIIIDDADHSSTLIDATFQRLFPVLLRPGGVYVIEDAYTAFQEDRHARFQTLVTDLQSNSIVGRSLDIDAQVFKLSPLEVWVESVEFRRNLVIVRKRQGLS